jgi:hypothetical protein
MPAYMWQLLIVMVLAGTLGGVINFYWTDPSDQSRTLLKSIVVGIGASFLVPLFLNMLSSNLIDLIRGTAEVKPDLSKLLIFAGFCLIASISSRVFIQTITDRLLREVQQAKQEAREAKQEASQAQEVIEPLIAREVEPEGLPSNEAGNMRALAPLIPAEHERLLDAFGNSRFALRTLSGLTADTKMNIGELSPVLERMEAEGLVGKRQGKKGELWFLTTDGRRLLRRDA